jgi:hypothetical protein
VPLALTAIVKATMAGAGTQLETTVRALPPLYLCSPSYPAGGDEAPISSLYAISVPGLTGARHMDAPSVSNDKLVHFDWAWISAARQVMELNLRDLLRSGRHQGVLRALLSLEGIRSCSAPGFPASAPEAATGEDGRTFGDGEGWDWAGVAGQWRCVVRTSLIG